jgi:leucyl-tRNA synthetase
MQEYLQRAGQQDSGWGSAVDTLVKLINPIAPHLGEEMWEKLGREGLLADAPWPDYDAAAAAESHVVLVVQVGGKVRDRLNVPVGLSEEEALKAALGSAKVRSILDGTKPSKVIYVPDRLINLVP